jgi:serine/threonine protein kinase
MNIGKYTIIEKLGQGNFGAVYKGVHSKTGSIVAIKLESANSLVRVLKHETTILNHLYSKHVRNIPPVLAYGKIGTYTYLAMPFYETPLHYYLDIPHFWRTFLKSSIQIMEHVHTQYVVHRDLKPDNWMIRDSEMILIDFGMATFFMDDRERHVLQNDVIKTHLIGTPKYASIRIHEGYEYTRRDDLISLAYIALWFVNPDIFSSPVLFPNTEYSATHRSHPANLYLYSQKQMDAIANTNGIPRELLQYINKVYSLSFSETPDYDCLVSGLS